MANNNNDKNRGGLTRREFLATSATATTLGTLGLSTAAGADQGTNAARLSAQQEGPSWLGRQRPNFLIFLVDEMRYPPSYETPEAQAFRQTYLKTQNALRSQGMEFRYHYAASVACAPSRASIYTGQYPSLHGVTQTTGAAKESFDPDVFWLSPNNVPTIGNYFRTGGYQTFWKGKWHISDADLLLPGTHSAIPSYDEQGQPVPEQEALYLAADRLAPYGFSGWIGPEPHGKAPLNSASSAKGAQGRDAGFATQAQQLIRQLHNNSSQAPWLIVNSFLNPHDITLWGALTNLPNSGFEFNVEDIVPRSLLTPSPCGPTQGEDLSGNNKPTCQLSYQQAYASVFQPSPSNDEYVRFYYQLHKNVDEQMLRVYQTLLSSRFRNNTIVIFTSDHGDLLGSHGGLHQKWHTAYEEAIHVPLIIANPLLFNQPVSTDTLTSHVDLLPTLLGLAGLDQENLRKQLAQTHTDAQPLVGRDLSSLVTGSASPDEQDAPLYFMTDDEPSRGFEQTAWNGIPYDSVAQPNHIETVISRLTDGKIWKYSRYFDNPQFWSNPASPASDTVVSPPKQATPSTEGTYTLEYTVTVKQTAVPDQFEMYNISDDPTEANNLYGNSAYQAQQQTLAALLEEQCAQKRLKPNAKNGTVPGQPDC